MSSSDANKLALLGGTPIRGEHQKWPSWPVWDDAERKALNEVLESGEWWFGKRVAQFEKEYAAFQDAAHCFTCNSGTAATEICLQAIDIQPGDEVIVPPFTFIATASSVARVGAIPVFVDVDDSWCLNPDLVEKAITPRTKAMIPVHFGGRVCDMDRLGEIARKHNLKIIEDACHSWGGKYKGKGTGALGDAGVFSFQMSKNITSAEGGAITTDDDAIAEACNSIRNCGRGTDGVWYGHVRVGTNARLTEFQAAILSAQLTRLEAQTMLREKNGTWLENEVASIPGLTPQPGDARMTRRAFHLFCVRINEEEFGCSREQFLKAAQAEGLPIGAGYALPLYKQPAFSEGRQAALYASCHCPVTEDLCYRSAMWCSHAPLLGSQTDMQNALDIFTKVKENASLLKNH